MKNPEAAGNREATIRRIGALDGWRGVAILLVMIDHCAQVNVNPLIHLPTRVGATGVGIFFALSGFLITTILLREQKSTGNVFLGAFYTRRVFRILPPVFAYLVVIIVFRELCHLHITFNQLSSSVLLYRNYIPADWNGGGYTGGLWSLMVEEHFYLFWPLLLIITRGNLIVLSIIALSDGLWRMISMYFNFLPDIWAPGRTDLRFDSLLWGCILAIILSKPHWSGLLKRRLSGSIMLLLVAIDIGLNILNHRHNYSLFEPIILALLLIWPILHSGSLLRKVLDQPILIAIGKISYSLYIWQQCWLLSSSSPTLFIHLQRFPFNIVMAFLCGTASYFVVERPLLEMGGRVVARMRAQRAGPLFRPQHSEV
jgi:peptidoglycan/LPS O-acetylase OafA/YrhL